MPNKGTKTVLNIVHNRLEGMIYRFLSLREEILELEHDIKFIEKHLNNLENDDNSSHKAKNSEKKDR